MYDSKTIYVDKDKNGSRQWGYYALYTKYFLNVFAVRITFIDLEIQGG